MRKPDYKVAPIFVNRWSPRAMSGDVVNTDELFSLFEAARWAPSSYNNQPWHFAYAHKSGPHWQSFFDLLVEFNQSWCKDAGALVIIYSHTLFEKTGKPSRTHAFDTGAAWQNFALQGSQLGLVVHGLEGFDYDAAARLLGLSKAFEVQAMAAIGHPGKKEDLSAELQERENPSERKKVETFAHEGPLKS